MKIQKKWLYLIGTVCGVIVVSIAILGIQHEFSFSMIGREIIQGKVEVIDYASNPTYIPRGDVNGFAGGGTYYPFEYTCGITVVAKLEEVLPDLYSSVSGCAFSAGSYNIMKFKILEVVYGENIPEEIYYLIPKHLDTDLFEYDALLLSIEQYGFESVPLVNISKMQMEVFPILFQTADAGGDPEMGEVIAFKNGVIDRGLWEKSGWNYASKYHLPENGAMPYFFPVKIGDTLEGAVSYIRECFDNWKGVKPYSGIVRTADFEGEDFQKLLAYVEPFENGVYMQRGYDPRSKSSFYTRMLGGFYTNDEVYLSVYNKKAEFRGEQYTQEELSRIPDLAQLISSLDLKKITPPHTPGYEKLDMIGRSVSGRYIKNNGKVYGCVKITWQMRTEDGYHDYFDDIYILVQSDGSYREVSRYEIKKHIGDDAFISNYQYGVAEDRVFD